jgi:hypothetical protein
MHYFESHVAWSHGVVKKDRIFHTLPQSMPFILCRHTSWEGGGVNCLSDCAHVSVLIVSPPRNYFSVYTPPNITWV